MSEESYPYNAIYAKRGDCKFDKKTATSCTIDSYSYADSGDAEMMKKALTHQPVSAVLNAASPSFKLYKSGVYDDELCSVESVDHAVVLVGFGSEDGEDYWIVKNSWGADWGEEGFIRMAVKPGDGICGV